MLINSIKSILISKTFIHLCLTVIIITSIYQGVNYSLYNQDYHHSFFILSMYIDLQNGFEYFEDIFLQYGPGQIIFLDLIDNIININIINIYNINVVVYSLNLLILFIVFKKVSNTQVSFLFIFIIFLIHPFSIYPWPDYLSGISLTLFFYFFLKKSNSYNYLSSLFLFLAVFFRSTYLINIFLSIFLYSLILILLKKKNPFKKEIILFVSFIIIYIFILIYNNYLGLWFSESMGIIGGYAQDTKHVELYDKITTYVGENGFILLKIIYYFLRSLKNLFNLTNFNNFIFVSCIIINLLFIVNFLKSKLEANLYEKKILFISLLGLTGFIQSLMLMEVFRNINSTIGIFVTSLYIINKVLNYKKKYSRLFFGVLFIYIALLMHNFHTYEYEKKKFERYDNKYFSKLKKVNKGVKLYYQDLENIICNTKNISLINISKDFAISYLCKKKFIKSKSSYTPLFLRTIKHNEYKRILVNHDLKKNELLVSSIRINEDKLILIKKLKNPHTPKEWYSDIYLYRSKNIN